MTILSTYQSPYACSSAASDAYRKGTETMLILSNRFLCTQCNLPKSPVGCKALRIAGSIRRRKICAECVKAGGL